MNWILLTTQMSLEVDFSTEPPDEHAAPPTSCDDLSREPSHALPDFWPTELWNNKRMLF